MSAVTVEEAIHLGDIGLGGEPGKSGSGAATSAISLALAAASRAPRSVKSLDDATPLRLLLTTRTRSPVSSRNVDWWITELAKRVSPPHSCV